MHLGSHYLGNGQTTFTIWAPLLQQVAVHLVKPEEKIIPLQRDDRGYWQGTLAASPGSLYYYQLDGELDRPDPASPSQPQGVHGPSAVVDHTLFDWTDSHWQGVSLEKMVIYELHVGTFTPAGTFAAILPRLPELRELGVNAIEIMPIAQFPGERNWGYDGVYPYAVQHSYGGIEGLKQLVDACHQAGLAVILDVVYNHLGPEGNYLWGLGTYFTDRYKTPWGSAVNYDDAYSDGTREYFVQNALYWFETYHIDALRLDAVHSIYDFGAKHILQALTEATAQLSQQQGRAYYLIAESDLNDPRIIRPIAAGGYGIHAQWCDDFHHVLHTLLTGENQGYYEDFGDFHQLAKVYQGSFAYDWTYSHHRKRHHGGQAADRPPHQFVVFSQNHDQVGNRMSGDRLSQLVSFEALKLAAALVILSPYIPLLFMGEEYGETNPFLYFISHGDPGLVEAVRAGRKEEFAAFHAEGEAPDPAAIETFEQSKLQWEKRHAGQHQTLWRFYQKLLQLRRTLPALANLDRKQMEVSSLETEQVILLRRWDETSQVVSVMTLNEAPVQMPMTLPTGTWQKILDSADKEWEGQGSSLPEKIVSDRLTGGAQQKLSLNPRQVAVYTTN